MYLNKLSLLWNPNFPELLPHPCGASLLSVLAERSAPWNHRWLFLGKSLPWVCDGPTSPQLVLRHHPALQSPHGNSQNSSGAQETSGRGNLHVFSAYKNTSDLDKRHSSLQTPPRWIRQFLHCCSSVHPDRMSIFLMGSDLLQII